MEVRLRRTSPRHDRAAGAALPPRHGVFVCARARSGESDALYYQAGVVSLQPQM